VAGARDRHRHCPRAAAASHESESAAIAKACARRPSGKPAVALSDGRRVLGMCRLAPLGGSAPERSSPTMLHGCEVLVLPAHRPPRGRASSALARHVEIAHPGPRLREPQDVLLGGKPGGRTGPRRQDEARTGLQAQEVEGLSSRPRRVSTRSARLPMCDRTRRTWRPRPPTVHPYPGKGPTALG
jgi:hypothetical protein